MPDMTTIADLAEYRGLDESTLLDAGIEVADNSHPYPGWFAIPYPHRQGIWKWRYRSPWYAPKGAKYLDGDNADFHLYNPGLLGANEPEVWVAEGEFDTLVLTEHGYSAFGIPGVSNVKDPEAETEGKFKRSWRHLFTGSLVIVAMDNDEKGLSAARRVARGLGGHIFDYGEVDYGDLNEWHADDPNGLAARLNSERARIRRKVGMT